MIIDGMCISFRGESHNLSDKPCQDCSGYFRNEDYAVSVIADGHGSKERSDIGAYAAVRISLSVIKEKMNDIHKFYVSIKENEDRVISELKQEIYNRWLDFIQRYTTFNNLNSDELRKISYDSPITDWFKFYGTTLNIGILSELFALCIQIGDSGCVIVYNDGNAVYCDNLIDDSIKGNIGTTSLSDAEAYKKMHHLFIDSEINSIPAAIALFSDGFEIEEDEHKDTNKDINPKSKLSTTAESVLRYFSLFPQENVHKDILRAIENRTHRLNCDDVSFSMVYNCNAKFSKLYYSSFKQPYPLLIPKTVAKKDIEQKICNNAKIENDNIFETAWIVRNGKEYSCSICNGVEENIVQFTKKDWNRDWAYYEKLSSMLEIKLPQTAPSLIYYSKIFSKYLKEDNLSDKDIISTFNQDVNQIYSALLHDDQYIEKINKNSNLEEIFRYLNRKVPTCNMGNTHIINYPESDKWISVENYILDTDTEGNCWNKKYEGKMKGPYFIEGTLYRDNGLVYKGKFSNNLENDECGFEYKDGKLVYVGQFIDGAKNGQGVSFSYNNRDVHYITGNYESGALNGYAEEKIVDIESMPTSISNMKDLQDFINNTNNEVRIRYCGFFKNGKYHGEGTLYDNSKSIYEGYFCNGVKNGFGIEYSLKTQPEIKILLNIFEKHILSDHKNSLLDILIEELEDLIKRKYDQQDNYDQGHNALMLIEKFKNEDLKKLKNNLFKEYLNKDLEQFEKRYFEQLQKRELEEIERKIFDQTKSVLLDALKKKIIENNESKLTNTFDNKKRQIEKEHTNQLNNELAELEKNNELLNRECSDLPQDLEQRKKELTNQHHNLLRQDKKRLDDQLREELSKLKITCDKQLRIISNELSNSEKYEITITELINCDKKINIWLNAEKEQLLLNKGLFLDGRFEQGIQNIIKDEIVSKTEYDVMEKCDKIIYFDTRSDKTKEVKKVRVLTIILKEILKKIDKDGGIETKESKIEYKYASPVILIQNQKKTKK